MTAFFEYLARLPWDACCHGIIMVPATIMLMAAAAAVGRKNLIHAVLFLILSFVALGCVFIALGAEFVGLVQLLVYVGAVAMLIVFAILLTRPDDLVPVRSPFAGLGPLAGVAVGLAVLVGLLGFIFRSPLAHNARPNPLAAAPTAEIGFKLMTWGILPLLAVGVLLTAALIGAAVLAIEDKKS